MKFYPYPLPPYSSVIDLTAAENTSSETQTSNPQTVDTNTQNEINRTMVADTGPPERVHSLRVKSNNIRHSNCDTRSLDGRISERGQTNFAFSDSSSTC